MERKWTWVRPCCTKEKNVIGKQVIDEVEELIYIGQTITEEMDNEIQRTSLGWAAYKNYKRIS